MSIPHQTLYFRRITCKNPDAVADPAPNRGYSLHHLLAMHLVDDKRIDFYFSTELIRVTGANLRKLWESLSKGDALEIIQSRGIGEIELVPYTAPPLKLIIPEAD